KPPAVVPPGGHDDHRTGTDRTTQVERRGTDVSGQDTSWQQQRPVGGTDTHTTTGATVPGQDDTTRTSGLTPVARTTPGDGTSGPNLPGGGFGRDGGPGDINSRLGTGPGLPGTSSPGGLGGFGTPGTGGESGSGRGGAGSG